MQIEPPDSAIPREIILEASAMARRGWHAEDPSPSSSGWTLRSLRADAKALGVAAWTTSARDGLRAEQQTLLEILADAGAAAIARARLAAGKAEAEARARTEDLRNALLSSISHDMRTPLAAIMVSASSLRRYGPTFDAPTQQDLAATIEEEATRLDAFVANLLNMSRLEAGALTVQRVGFNVAEVIERTLARHDAGQQRVTVVMASNLNEGLGDPLLFEQALGNIVENAVRYVPPAASIEVLAHEARMASWWTCLTRVRACPGRTCPASSRNSSARRRRRSSRARGSACPSHAASWKAWAGRSRPAIAMTDRAVFWSVSASR